MLSQPKHHITRSAIFRWCLLTSLGFLLICLLACVLFVVVHLVLAERDIKHEIQEGMHWLTELYEEDGLAQMVAELSIEENAIWDEDTVFDVVKEEEFVVRVSTPAGATVVGYEGLYNKPGWHEFNFDFEDFERPLFVLVQEIDNKYRISVGKFSSQTTQSVVELISFSVLALLVIVLPLSWIMGYFVSRAALRRLENVSETAEKISTGELNQRIQLSSKNDEFDRLSSQVNAMLDHVEKLNKNVKNVSVGIAHDLKTPISHLSGRLQRISQNLHDPEAIEIHLKVAEEHIENIIRTFEALLRLAEIETGERRKLFHCFDLSELLEEVVDSYEPLFSEAGFSFDVSILPSIQLRGDEDLIVQMITNLLENILQYGDARLGAWLRLQHDEQGIVIQVGDGGPGIPEKHQSRIFERFYRADSSRHSPGNGLGLALVKSICDLHQAKIVLLPNQPGTVFNIQIPVH